MHDSSWFKKQLQLLVSLQKFYSKEFILKKDKETYNFLIEEKTRKNKLLKEELENSKENLALLKKKITDLNFDLERVKEKLDSMESKEKNVQTQKEFTAMNNERLKLANESEYLKKELESIIRESVQNESEIKTLTKDFNQDKKALNEFNKTIADKQDSLEKILTKLKEERTLFLEDIDRQFLSRFKIIIKSKKDTLAIVPIIDEVCQGCNIAVSATTFFKVMKTEDFVFCSNCSRILYIPASLYSLQKEKASN